jgi:hypothetical protein
MVYAGAIRNLHGISDLVRSNVIRSAELCPKPLASKPVPPR